MRLLHPLPIPGSDSGSNLNQILQPVGAANPPNAHFTNAFSSRVGGVTGYEGAGGSAAALAGNPGYKITMKGGKSLRRGGRSRNRNRSKCRCKKSCNCRCKKSCNCRSKHRKSRRSHGMRGGGGGLSATAAPFNGANPPYQQYMSNQPNSPVFSVGSKTLLPHSAMANPPTITSVNRCEK